MKKVTICSNDELLRMDVENYISNVHDRLDVFDSLSKNVADAAYSKMLDYLLKNDYDVKSISDFYLWVGKSVPFLKPNKKLLNKWESIIHHCLIEELFDLCAALSENQD